MKKLYEKKVNIDYIKNLIPDYIIVNGYVNECIYEEKYSIPFVPLYYSWIDIDNIDKLDEKFNVGIKEKFDINIKIILMDIFDKMNLTTIRDKYELYRLGGKNDCILINDRYEIENAKVVEKNILDSYNINIEIPDIEYFFNIIKREDDTMVSEHSNILLTISLIKTPEIKLTSNCC